MMRRATVILLWVTAVILWSGIIHPCGFEQTFRVYLDKRFWQPLSVYEKSLGKARGDETPKQDPIFAGMSGGEAGGALKEAGEAYRLRDFARARAAVDLALKGNPSDKEREELLLLDAKVDMREGEARDPDLLARAGSKLRSFIGDSQVYAFRSEAQGWLARVRYLMKDYPPAAKFYLDELSNPDSIFDRDTLITSLRILFPYNGSSAHLVDHLEEYFDTPSHALFVVGLVTNPVYNGNGGERANMSFAARKTIEVLLKRRDMFTSNAESEALALALMRASLYMGDTRSALAYSEWIPRNSETANTPEFNWMVAGCRFLQREYDAAKEPLLKMYNAKQAGYRDRCVAALGLTGVYQKLGRGVDQLHAAFLYYQAQQGNPRLEDDNETWFSTGPYYNFMYLPASGWLIDLSYLLDVQLSDKELSQYLKKYSKPAMLMKMKFRERSRSAYEIVEYALAVRCARQEKYGTAASIYEKIDAKPRAARMRYLARLRGEAGNAGLSPPQLLEAQYAYAAFLEEHSTQVFFNDMFWYGSQRYVFMGSGQNSPCEPNLFPLAPEYALTAKERAFFLVRERRLKDDQEERWRAYKMLDAVMEKAGRSDLGLKANAKALKCLKLINIERFGREKEINSAIRRLSDWRKTD